ncbi:magnesium transporter CorA family protein [Nitratifractor salsuginis]|uniref:Mg2 transporter protein CorA family protein n=1 Tax=Nitratifractor salsuginis (strain DSM 16511 / JCM 12458 / E9I37-1) TaxID=749222 RepID=E6WYH8_NITSE|nr:magnesium transporter CorA family protein [Nitratifractor salsuginis]ADV46490.1 Mg2 transporter protein CorA family protein [Nitratifractor salsuginis DSM 16511]
MYLFSDRLYRKDEIVLDDSKKQVIFTTINNQTILDWLREHDFPESFIEDIRSEEQSITYEEHERFKLIILKYFIRDEEDELHYQDENVVIIVTENTFIFLARSEKVIKAITAKLYRRYRQSDSLPYITYTVIDIMVDHTMWIIDRIDDTLEEIEDRIFADDLDEQEVQKHLYFARRTLNRISKLSVQSTDVINKIYNHLPVDVRKKLKYEFIDLKEHLSYTINESKSYLDRTGYLQNLLMGFMSNRMNQAMQRLAAISLIFLPLTFIVGNYGMNFKYMPELDWKYGYLAVWIVNILIAWLIFRWLKKQKWI